MAACMSSAGMAAPPASACHRAAPRHVVEAFIDADCQACWQQKDSAASRPDALRLDWIVPSDKGDEAALAAAALPEAAQRLAQPPGQRATAREHSLPTVGGFQLQAQSGLAWNGYLGLSLDLHRNAKARLPADVSGWLALVERIPADTDGTPVARQLVRTVIGPLPLDLPAGQDRLQHLRAVLMPPNSQPDRLAAVAWVQRADGRMLMAAQSPAAGCQADD